MILRAVNGEPVVVRGLAAAREPVAGEVRDAIPDRRPRDYGSCTTPGAASGSPV